MGSLEKRPNENERQYIWRVGQMVDGGEVGSWKEIAPILNEQLRNDESEYRDESAYRKPYQYAKSYYEDVFSKMESDEHIANLENATQNLYKQTIRFQDQRREYNKILREQARQEHLRDTVKKCAEKMSVKLIDKSFDSNHAGDCEAVVCFSDWHYGMVCDNIWNQYNTEICKYRVSLLVSRCKEYLAEKKPKKLHILLLGDSVHGAIHTSARVASEEDVCDQYMHVAELIALAVEELSAHSSETFVYSTYGNHCRTVQNKNDSIHSDNMEKLVPWWLEQRFKENNSVNIINTNTYEFIDFNVCGYNIVAVHGDKEKFKEMGNVINTIFSKNYGHNVDYVICGDKHHREELNRFNIESILVSSLCGTDEYADGLRLYSNAEQTLLFFTERDGRQCSYNIKLD